MTTREYTCANCGSHVVSYGIRPQDPDVCSVCLWVANVADKMSDPKERQRFLETVRRFRGLGGDKESNGNDNIH